MTRKMAYIGLSYICGLFFASFFAPFINAVLLCSIILIFLLYVLIFRERKVYRYVIVISFAVAMLYNIVYSLYVYEPLQTYEGAKVSFSGKIAQAQSLAGGKARYIIDGKINGKRQASVIVIADDTQGEAGDTFSSKLSLERLDDSLTFSEKAYYKSKGVYLKSSECKDIEITKNKGFSLTRTILSYRDYIAKRLSIILPGTEGDFINSILCGKKDKLDSTTQSNLYRAGIGHITSISGTHLMIISALLYIILNAVPVGKKFKFVILETVIIGYAVFSGFSVSVLRTAIMFTIVISADVFLRRADVLNSLGIAGIILTAANPFSVRDASFVLSFAGVFAIGVVAPLVNSYFNFQGKTRLFKSSLVAMLCVSFCTLPFVVMYFDELSVISPLSNIFLAPVYSVILICGFLVALTGGVALFAYPLLFVGGMLTKLLLFLCSVISKIPFSYVPTGSLIIHIAVPLCVAGVAVICFKLRTSKAFIASSLCCVFILLSVSFINNALLVNKLEITVLSDSNCCAIVLNMNKQTCIINMYGSVKSARLTESYISKNGIGNIDALILTDKSQKSVSSYIDNISVPVNEICFNNKDNVVFPSGYTINEFGDDTELVAGKCTIKRISRSSFRILYGDFEMMVNADNGADKLYLDTEDKLTLKTKDKLYMSEQKENSRSFYISACADGRYKVRRMSDGLRK